MKNLANGCTTLWMLCIVCLSAVPAEAQAPYTQLHSNIGWSPANFSTVADVAAAFGSARTAENAQLGTSIPTALIMPPQGVWDAWSSSQKALYLINAERTARGLLPFESVSRNIVAISQGYADSLLADNAFTHTLNETTPGSRLDADPAINGCSEQGYVFGPECLSGFVATAPPIPMPIERSVHSWIYEDSSSSWGHRNTMFASLNNDFGPTGNEGFVGVGLATGGPYSGFGGAPWAAAAIVVFDFVDPCQTSTLEAGQTQLAAFTPGALNFSRVSLGQSKRDTVTVRNWGVSAISVVKRSVSDTSFSVTPDSTAIAAGDSARFFVTFRPARADTFTAKLAFSTGDTLALAGRGTPAVASVFSPSSLAFGQVQIGLAKQDTVKVRNAASDILTLIRKPLADTSFAASPDTLNVSPGDSSQIFVTFRPARAETTLISLVYTANGTATDTIALSGIGIRAPGGTVSPAAIAFDSVLVLASRRDSIKVRNTGSSPFSFKAKSAGDSAFAVSPDSALIAAGDSARFIVTYKPLAAGADTGKILVTGPTRTDTVTVRGTGKLLSLSAVRKTAVGTLVSFQGSVSRAKGNFVYLQDSLAGIVLFQSSGMVRDSVASGFIKTGDRLIVNGKTSLFNNLLELASADISGFLRVARGDSVKAVRLTLSQTAAQGSTYEGMLVTVDSLQIVGTTDTLFRAGTSYSVIDKDTSRAVVLRIPSAGDSDVDSTVINKRTFFRFTGPLGHFSVGDSTKGYQLMAVAATDITWESPVTGVRESLPASDGLPTVFALSQNYPNPFNPTTRIEFSLPRASMVQLKVYDVIGREVATLANGQMPAGRYTVSFNGGNLASGVYFYRLAAGTFVQTRSLLLVK